MIQYIMLILVLKKSESDVKRITHQYTKINGEFIEIDK